MSADNYLIIDKNTFEVFHGGADGAYEDLVGKGGSLVEAVEIAEDFEKKIEKDGMVVEYGVRFR